MDKLKVGDKVMWRGSFGSAIPQLATVKSIELCEPGEKYGEQVDEASWSDRDRMVVDLDNHSWAYGYQISPA